MSSAWITVAVMAIGTAAIKAAGPFAVGGEPPSERVEAVIGLLAPALLAGLVVYETVSTNHRGVTLDARVIGLAAGALALAARLPLIVVIVAAAGAAAAARALT